MNAIELILGNILAQQYSFTPLVVPRTRLRDNLVAYEASFIPNKAPTVPFWEYHVFQQRFHLLCVIHIETGLKLPEHGFLCYFLIRIEPKNPEIK